MIEPVVLLFGLVATCLAIFGFRGLGFKDDVLAFLAFPFVIWAAFRFRAFGAALATLLISALSVWGTAHEVDRATPSDDRLLKRVRRCCD